MTTPSSARQNGDVVSRELSELSRQECLELLASAPFGRIVFTSRALPAIRPVNHLVDDGRIVICSHDGAAIVPLVAAVSGSVVAYEADAIDPLTYLGWSVVVTGIARQVNDHDELDRLRRLITPWISRPMDTVIAITPHLVTGLRLVTSPQT